MASKKKQKFNVITLCGSTKFKDQFLAEQKRLTLEGNIVISVGCFGHSGDDEVWTEGTKQMLDDMHKAKIDMSDEIFVINVNNYIGKSTQSEIDYAIKTGKTVKYLEHTNCPKLQYISYQITLGGDAGWRFSNHDEWCSMNYFLYFNAALWTMERIKDAIDKLNKAYWSHKGSHGFTLDETGKIGAKYIRQFFEENEGVYATERLWGALDENSDRLIAMPANEDVTRWSKPESK